MSEHGTHSIIYAVLVSYLQECNKKSYCKHNRDFIVDSLSPSFDSQDLDNTWSRNFLKEVERLVDKNT
ncbi:uncharacterized protein OCT59_002396 [Rhizophagus irregularis]|uniref:uncharacterized protein n=1 Tax=Rhizophagus irregularis TaxID=588596 RepID=UPI001A0D8BF1|nr:hypothetical protein OCT59_002396 [Rhizophagus irregularis]GET57260.1 hypothetical protein RIR_e62693_A0A2I1EJF8_9GLOM [Rhizophagus irregularis DAOM 181602=DAOM 197198]CAG8545762.1 11481_t:CDS:2 [Rhizophagus irregularis]